LFKADKNIFNGIGIFSSSNSLNLFTSNKGTEESAKTQANPTPALNIFNTNATTPDATTNTKNLFNKGSASLKGTTASLFQSNNTQISQQITSANNDDDGSGDSAQL
jgi:hypothetical protein